MLPLTTVLTLTLTTVMTLTLTTVLTLTLTTVLTLTLTWGRCWFLKNTAMPVKVTFNY